MEKVKKPFDKQRFIKEYGIILIFVVLVAVMTILSPNFAQPKNLINILKQTSINGILSLGMMFVIISGGFDLSVGSIVGVSGVAAAYLGMGEYPLIIPLLACIGLGALFGLGNGIGISFGNLPPFIMTLGMMTVLRGLALVISGGQPVTGISGEYVNISSGFLFGIIPYLAVYFVIAIAICAFVLTKTVYGRRIYSCGGNMLAARVSGINVKAMQTSVYMIAGIMAGVAGFLLTARTTVGAPTAGEGYEMDAITACVIGGVSMNGGTGKWYGVVVGALIISVIANGLDILGVSSHYQKIIKGIIIIVAVLADVNGKNAR